jgi:hypothetical protein
MSNKSFPHPVLDPANSDYPNCGIQFRATMASTPITYRFEGQFDLGSDTLQSAIDAGNARYAIQLDCRWTSFRRVYKFDKPECVIEIPESALRGSVFLSPYILAEQNFTLSSDEFNELFRDLSFPLRRSYVLAWDHPQEFYAEKTLDDLKNINSILQVVRSAKVNTPIEYDLTRDKIEIHLPQEDFETYSLFKSNPGHQSSLMCMLALPALACALSEHLRPDREQSTLRWSRVLDRRIADLKLPTDSDKDPWFLAQRILDLPISRALKSIKTYQEGLDS